MENSIEIPQKIKIRTTIQSCNSTLGYLSKENKNISWKTYLHFYVHCSRAKIQKNLSVHWWIKQMWCVRACACVCVCVCIVVQSLNHVQFFCNPMYYSPLGSSVPGISQARILEWVAISFSRGSSWSRDQTCTSYLASGFLTTEPPGQAIPPGQATYV